MCKRHLHAHENSAKHPLQCSSLRPSNLPESGSCVQFWEYGHEVL
jgi:hypothetical protein